MIDLDLVESEIRALEAGDTDFDTCEKLAALYSVREHCGVRSSGSEFLQACSGRPVAAVLAVMDELMDAEKVLNPSAYAAVIARLREV